MLLLFLLLQNLASEIIWLNSSSCHSSSNSISTSCGAWHGVHFQLMSPMQMSALVWQITRCLYLCMNTLVSLPRLLPFITWVDRSWHVGRRRNLNAGNWAKTLLFLPPVQIIYHLLHNRWRRMAFTCRITLRWIGQSRDGGEECIFHRQEMM